MCSDYVTYGISKSNAFTIGFTVHDSYSFPQCFSHGFSKCVTILRTDAFSQRVTEC